MNSFYQTINLLWWVLIISNEDDIDDDGRLDDDNNDDDGSDDENNENRLDDENNDQWYFHMQLEKQSLYKMMMKQIYEWIQQRTNFYEAAQHFVLFFSPCHKIRTKKS